MKTLSETAWRNASCISPVTPLRATLVAPGELWNVGGASKGRWHGGGTRTSLGRIWRLTPHKAVTIGLGRATREPFESNHYVCLWAAAQLRHLSASSKCMIAMPFSRSSGPGRWLIGKLHKSAMKDRAYLRISSIRRSPFLQQLDSRRFVASTANVIITDILIRFSSTWFNDSRR